MDRQLSGQGWSIRLDSNRLFAGVIGVMLILFVIMNSPWPLLGCDEAAWLTSVVKVLHGKVMGREAVLAKGPYLLLWHLVVYVVTGPSLLALKAIGLLWKMITGIVICLLAFRVAGREGVVATGLLYIGATSDPALCQSVYAETIFALPLAVAVALIVFGRGGHRLTYLGVAGFLAGFAVLVKQSAAITFLALMVAIIVISLDRSRRAALAGVGSYLLGAVLSAVPWAVYLYIYRAGHSASADMVSDAADYIMQVDAGQSLANLGWAAVFVLPRFSIAIIASLAGLGLLYRAVRSGDDAEGMGSADAQQWRALALTVGLWYISSVLISGATLRFAAHYLNQFAAPAALVGGIWIARAMTRGGLTTIRGHLNLPVIIGVTQLAVICVLLPSNVQRWQRAVEVSVEGSPMWEAGAYLKRHAAASDTVFVWGDMQEVLYWAERELSAHSPWMTLHVLGLGHVGPLEASRVREKIDWKQFSDHLKKDRPDWVVVAPLMQTLRGQRSQAWGTDDLPKLRELLEKSYRLQNVIEGYEMWRRKEPDADAGSPRSEIQLIPRANPSMLYGRITDANHQSHAPKNAEGFDMSTPPVIEKLGTVECDLVEATPIVWEDRLLRYEYVRAKYYKPNQGKPTYFRFIDWDTGEQVGSDFAEGYVLGCAYTEGGRMWGFGSNTWGGEEVRVFWSDDLQTWDSETALDLSGWGIYNTSVCRGPEGYTMAFEVGEPEDLVGQRFTIFFARSDDLRNWEVLGEEHSHTKERYAACPALRYLDGMYYMVYLEAMTHMEPTNWQLYIARSPNLIDWELADSNPVLAASDDDRKVANPNLDEECRERIQSAVNINNSDFDLCEYGGQTYINYSWGNQHGVEHLAAAVYHGPMDEFLKGWFAQ